MVRTLLEVKVDNHKANENKSNPHTRHGGSVVPPGTTVVMKSVGDPVIAQSNVCVMKKLIISLFGPVADLAKPSGLPSELSARHEVDIDSVRVTPQVSNGRSSRSNTTKPKGDQITEKALPFRDTMVQTPLRCEKVCSDS
jgi:hypothetical protein